MRTLRNVLRFATTLILVLLFGGTARSDDHTVKIATKDQVGSYLTDAKGMTLYVFKKDSPRKSACSGGCVTAWPLFYREKVGVPDTLQADDFATITREDGKKQTTYKGLPLYYFAGDKLPLDTNGQGVKDVWFVAAP